MNVMKKLFALVLVLTLVLGLSLTAFASEVEPPVEEEEKGSITLTGVHEGQTYKIYKLLDLESYDAEKGLYVYTMEKNSPWVEFFQTGGGAAYVSLETSDDLDYYLVSAVQASGSTNTAEQLALSAITYAKEKNIAPTDSVLIAQVSNYTFENLDLGYYLIDSTVGALCGLQTTDKDATVAVKNDPPVPEKVVQENSTEAWGAENDIWIGGTVNFRTTFTKEPGAQNYVVHDKMSAGLTFDSTSVKIEYKQPNGDWTNVAATYTNSSGQNEPTYTLTTANLEDGCTFEIAFANGYMRGLAHDTEVRISYCAILNEDAVVDGRNPNETWMTYGDDNETRHDETVTYTWSLGIYKYSNINNVKAPLAGATFEIYTEEPEIDMDGNVVHGQPVGFIELGTTKNTINGVEYDIPTYRIATKAEQEANADITSFTTTEVGYLKFVGLDSGDFYVVETAAPGGYARIQHPIRVDIGTDGNVTVDNESFVGDYVQIVNRSGTALPETGGMGTTLFYIIGATLALGAAVVLITKRRMNIQ